MEEDLLSALTSSAGVAALVADRVQWAESEDQDCIALHLIDANPDWTLKGPSGLSQDRVQIDCWAGRFLSAKAIGVAVLAALPAIGQVIGSTKFLSCVVLDTERGRFGERPNLFHRTRIDVRVSHRPA